MPRIAHFSLFRLRVPLKKPFVTSLGPSYEADNVVVIVRTTDGLLGFGECNPFWTINGETAETGL
ncbi:MAG TPA: hypothetical protein PKL41_12750, partial [Flavobacteriales bacterium]|nr:hypothetical protein [Flavobacteriales bacterium]